MYLYQKNKYHKMDIGVYSSPLFKQITSDDKWYAAIPVGDGYMSAQHANRIKKAFNNGTLKLSTLSWLFGYFGYEIKEKEIVWIKKK